MSVWAPEKQTSVLVAAASPVTRAGLESILAREPAFAVLGGDAGATLAQEIERYDPDVVLLEIADPVAGDDALAELHLSFENAHDERGTGPVVVALVDAAASGRSADALRRSVRALLPRTAGAAEILAAIHAAALGLVVVPAAWLRELLGADLPALELAPLDGSPPPTGGLDAGAAAELTAREREVLQMIGEGLANKQIAARLGISSHTVKFHVASVFAKLHASTRAEAAMTGARRGLIVL